MDLPCAVCIDSGGSFASDASPSALIAQILGKDSLPTPPPQTFLDGKVKAYELELETKYYSTKIWLCSLSERTIGDSAFSEAAEVVVITFDGSWLGELDSWLPFLAQWEIQVRILVCKRISSDPTVKKAVVNWCRDHSFELVELEPSEESLEEASECGEVTGVPRIRQLLKAHPWANLELKEEETSAERIQRLRAYLGSIGDSDEICPDEGENAATAESSGMDESTLRELASRLAEKNEHNDSESANPKQSDISIPTSSHCNDGDDKIFQAVDGGEDPGGVSFEELFSTFASMKERGEGLEPEARREYAEKVTMAFWKAIGGDENELEGLDSLDDQ